MPVSRRGSRNTPPAATPIFSTTREREGYDFMRHGRRCWFEAWGKNNKKEWTTRAQNGRPPSPADLANAEYIVIGIDGGNPPFVTMIGGLDL